MSTRTIHQQSNRCTLTASDLNRTTKASRTADVSVTELTEEYVSARGRKSDPKVGSDDQLHQTSIQQVEKVQSPEGGSNEASDQNSNTFRPTFTLPPTVRRPTSPDSLGQRAATPHPRKATLPRSESPKTVQQPALSFRGAGLVALACCRWNHEDYKHQLHMNWLNNS